MPANSPPVMKEEVSGLNGPNLKALRTQADLTLEELGERAGVKGQYIWRLENHVRDGRSETIRRIADALAAALDRPVGDILKELTDPA